MTAVAVVAIDQGTTSTRAIAFDRAGKAGLLTAQIELTNPGGVTASAEEQR